MTDTHVYRWKKYNPVLYRQPCRVLARGKMNSVFVEFAGGVQHVVSRNAVRKIK